MGGAAGRGVTEGGGAFRSQGGMETELLKEE